MWPLPKALTAMTLACAISGGASASAPERRLGTLTFDAASAPSSNPSGFNLVSRVYVPYGAGTGFAYGMGAAEKIAFDPAQKYAYAISEQGYVNIVDFANPAAPAMVDSLALNLAGMRLTDVSICPNENLLFVAFGASDKTQKGAVRVYSSIQRQSPPQAASLIREIEVGPLPDMIAPNADCTMVAVANEGEGVYGTSLVNPEGSVSIIRNPSSSSYEVHHVTFGGLGSDEELIAAGVHLPLPKKALEYWDDHSSIAADLDFATARTGYTTAMNLEPEYLGWSADGSKVYVNLQENSAIVTVSVPTGDWSTAAPTAVRIDALGLKDWSKAGGTEGIDLKKDGKCVLAHYDGFQTLRNADSIAVVSVDGVDYILTANEGDDIEYGDYEEKWKAKDLLKTDGTMGMAGATVDSQVLADYNKQDSAGANSKRRLTVGSAAVDYSTPNAPVLKALVGFGGRSFSIFQPTASGLNLVWDSGSSLEKEQCAAYPWAHNGIQDEEFALLNGVLYNSSSSSLKKTIKEMSDPDEDGCADRGDGQAGPCPLGGTVDERSPKDGAAPEAIVAGVACGRLVAVTVTEKQSTAFVYDITNIKAPSLLFVRHLSPASRSMTPELLYDDRKLGEIDPESIVFLDSEHSPSGKAGVLFGGAWSGTISFWEFECPAVLTNRAVLSANAFIAFASILVSLAAMAA